MMDLLRMERDAEVAESTAALTTRSKEDLASAGISLFRLRVVESTVGLMGRAVVDVGDSGRRRH